MNELYVIVPEEPSSILSNMIDAAIEGENHIIIKDNNLPNLKHKRIIFAIELNEAGFCINLSSILTELNNRGEDTLEGAIAGVLIHSPNDLYTKTVAQNTILHLNSLGCRFPGRPLVEATGSLRNFLTLQKVIKKPLEDVAIEASKRLANKIRTDSPKLIKNPNILVLHSSNRKTSNSIMLWDMVHKHLSNFNIREIHIENGTVRDCKGCPYTTCKHYGEQTSCFYGGIMVEEVYPAVLDADAVIWICPNYNDAISANLTAVINRLTALFRKTKFYDKSLFGIIVSGNSGSDTIAKQLISALNINKTFRLPPKFSIMATANDKDAIFDVNNIEKKAEEFAENLKNEIKK